MEGGCRYSRSLRCVGLVGGYNLAGGSFLPPARFDSRPTFRRGGEARVRAVRAKKAVRREARAAHDARPRPAAPRPSPRESRG